YRFRRLQRVEAQVQGPPRLDGDLVGSRRLAVGEVHGERDLRRHVAGVEDATGLVALQFRGRAVALAGDVAFRDRPACASDAVHGATNSSASAQAASTKKPRHCGGAWKSGGASRPLGPEASRPWVGFTAYQAVTGCTPAACAPFGPCWTS